MNRGTEAFWLLSEPFEADPDARFLIQTRPIRAVLGALRDALSHQPGWIALVGEAGIGKSVLTRLWIESLGDDSPIAFVADAGVDCTDLRSQIDAQLGEAGAPVTTDLLLRAHRAGRRPLVILDGAQDFSEASALELEAALSAPLEGGPVTLLVDLIAVIDGDPEAPLPDWAHRRRPVKLALGALDASDTAEYVRRRIRLAAGGERDLFDPGALTEVFRRTTGRPDAINRVCGLALDRVAAAGRGRVGSEDVREAAQLLGDLIGEVQLALAIAEASTGDGEGTAPSSVSAVRARPSLADRSAHPSATHANSQRPISPRPPARPAATSHSNRATAWKLAAAAAVGCAIGAGLTLWLAPLARTSDPNPSAVPSSQTSTAETNPVVDPSAPIPIVRIDEPTPANEAPGSEPTSGGPGATLPTDPSALVVAAMDSSPESALAAKGAETMDAIVEADGTIPIPSLPLVAAPPPPERLRDLDVTPEPTPPGPSARTRLPVEQAAPILALAFADHAAAGTAWVVQFLDDTNQPIERAELAHAESDGGMRTLASVEGTGERRAARLLDQGSDPSGESAKVFWPEDRVMRSVGADDPFAGTGFRYSDFRPHRVHDFTLVGLVADRRDDEPIFVVTAQRAGPVHSESFEFVVAERDGRLLEIRESAHASSTHTRRLLLERRESTQAPVGARVEEWRVFGPDDREVARARVEVSRLAEDAGPDLFTFSRLSDPGFSVPKR